MIKKDILHFFILLLTLICCTSVDNNTSQINRLVDNKATIDLKFENNKLSLLFYYKQSDIDNWEVFNAESENKPYDYEKFWIFCTDKNNKIVKATYSPNIENNTNHFYVTYYFDQKGKTFAIESLKASDSTFCTCDHSFKISIETKLSFYDDKMIKVNQINKLTDNNKNDLKSKGCEVRVQDMNYPKYKNIKQLLSEEKIKNKN